MEFLNTIFNGPAAALTSSTQQVTNSPRSRDLPSRETMFRLNQFVQVDGNHVTPTRANPVTRMSPENILSNNDGMAHTLIEHSGNIMHSSQNGESNIGEEILQPKSTRNAIYGSVAAVPYDSFGKPGPSWDSAQETGVVQRGVGMSLSRLLIILKMTDVPDDKDCPLVGDEEGGQMYNRTILDLFHEIKRLKAQQKNVSQLVGAVKGCTDGDIATNDAVLDALRAFDNDPLFCGDPGPCMDGCKSQSNNDITKSVTLRQDLKGSAKDLTGVATLAARFEFGITLRNGVQPRDLAKMVHAHVEDEKGPQHEVEQAKQNVDDLSLKHEDESEQVERQLQSLIQEDQQVCKSIHATKGQRSPRVLKVSNDGRACETGTSLQLKTIPTQQQIRQFTNDQYEGEVQRDVRTRRLTPSGSIEHLRRNFEVNSNANTASFATSETAPRPLTKCSPEGSPDNFQIECMAPPLTQTPTEAESVRNRLSRVEQLLKRSSEIKQAVDEGYPLYCSSGLGKVRTPTSESMLSEPDPAPASTRKVSDDTHQSADSISTPYLTSSIQQMTPLRERHREQGNTKSNTATVYQNWRTDDQGRSSGTVPDVHNVLQPSNATSSVMKSVELLGESNSIANSPPKSTSPDKREMGPSVTDLRKHLESATNTKKQSDSKSSSVFTRNAVTIIPLKVKSIDELRAHHEQFVEQKEKACLPASPRVLRCTSTKCREVGEQRPRWSSTETRECSNFNGADVTRSTKATSSTETDQPTPRQQVIAPAIASSIAQAAPAQGGRKLEETREENQIQIKAFYEKQQYGNVSSPIRTSESATQRLALPMQGSFEEGRSSIQKTITNTTRSAPRMHNDRQTSIHAAHASGAATSPRKSSGDPVQSVSSYNQNYPRAQLSYNQNHPKAHSQISDNFPGGVKSQYEAFARQPSHDDAHASEAAQASSPSSVSISNISQDVSISNIEKLQYGNGSTRIRTSEIATQRLALPKQGSFEEGRSSIQKTITNTTRSAPRMHNDRQTSIHAAHASGAATSPRKSSGDPVQSVSSYNQNYPRAQLSYNQNHPRAHSQISDNSPGGVKSQYEAFARQPSHDDAHASEAAPAPDVSISNKSQYQTFLKIFGSGKETLDNWQEARAAVATIAASSRTQINSLQSTSSHVQGQSIRSASTLQHNGQERGIGTVASTGGSGYRSTTTQPRPNEMGSSISYSRTHQPTYLPPQTRAQREFDRLSVNTCTSENQKRPAVSNTRTWGELVEWA